MRNSIYLVGLLVITLLGAGCSKDKGGGKTTRAYAPDSCYGNQAYNGNYNYNNQLYNQNYNASGYHNPNYNYNYNPNSQFGNQYNQRYQWQNRQCIDTQDGDIVSSQYCNNIQYSGNYSCNYYGQGNGYYTGGVNGAYNACSLYNGVNPQTGIFETFYPVYYPSLGVTVCAGYTAMNALQQYGSPIFYGGYNNIYQGCVPGTYSNRCNCQGFGGSLGWLHAGVSLGVCY